MKLDVRPARNASAAIDTVDGEDVPRKGWRGHVQSWMMAVMATSVFPEHVAAERVVVKPQRVLSVDVLRGLTIALMILVNDPGDWSHVYAQLDHSAWNGFTLTDFVFPNFLFIVGASIIFSVESRMARGESRRSLALHIFRRAATIFIILIVVVHVGFVLTAFAGGAGLDAG